MKNITKTLITIMTLFLLSCEKDDSNNDSNNSNNNPHYKEKNYKMIVVDESNQPIANAVISDGTNSITSNSSGTATFNTPNETYGKYRFSINKDGYFVGSLNLVTFSDPDNTYKVMLLQSSNTSNIPNTGGTVTGTGWTFISTGGFNYENGSTATGNIDISIRYIKPSDFESLRNAFPGQDFTGLSGSNDSWLYIYGWVAISYSLNGVRVYPSNGSVNIKVQVPGVYANAAQNGGKVFYYDEAAKIWEESANPIVSGLDVTMPLPSQTTFCALGKMVPTATIKYKKTTCMPGDFYGYGVQIEYDYDNLSNYINSLIGFHVSLTETGSGGGGNSSYGADLYPSGFALGNIPMLYLSHATGSTDGTYTNAVFDNLGFENETFTFPAAYNGGFKIHSIRIPLKQGEENNPISDKIIKEYVSFPVGVTNLGVLNTVCTGTTPNPHSGNNNSNNGNGNFAYNGQTISGTCSSIVAQTSGCTGIDVIIGSSNNFIIQNMPSATSGTFNVNGDGSNCNPRAITLFGGASQSTSGTITKTGLKSFTFNITMENLSTGGTNLVATGSGNYN